MHGCWMDLVVRRLQHLGGIPAPRTRTRTAMPPTTSIWQQTFSVPKRPALTKDLTVDVCVVGAGIAGLSVAWALARAGKRVAVLEMDQVGSGESGRTTAHLSNELDDRYLALEKARGEADARLALESHSAAINRIEETVRIEG